MWDRVGVRVAALAMGAVVFFPGSAAAQSYKLVPPDMIDPTPAGADDVATTTPTSTPTFLTWGDPTCVWFLGDECQ
jgi:hypothetical protein